MKRTTWRLGAAVAAAVLVGCFIVTAPPPAAWGAAPPAAGQRVSLPRNVNDQMGNTWMIYPAYLQQQGPQPVYSQGAMLQINGNSVPMRNSQATLDEKTGELTTDPMAVAGLSITRRILPNTTEGYVRYLDIISNPQGREVSANLTIQSSFNYSIEMGQTIPDPRRKGQNLGWVGQTPVQRAVVEVFAGPGAKLPPSIDPQPNSNVVRASFQLKIPPGRKVAVLHLHSALATQDAGVQFITALKPQQILQSVPADLRKIIVNFGAVQGFIGQYEILRGDIADVIELRGGDLLNGTIQEPAYQLTTFYAPLTLPTDRVVGMINVGSFRPRQLLITSSGEILGGQLQKSDVKLQLASGQVIQVPLNQIARMGYRRRAGEPEEWTFDQPVVLMRSGDRVGVQMPSADIRIATRYGELSVKPQMVAGIIFQTEEGAVHQMLLSDGSQFAGLVSAPQIEMKLAHSEQLVRFPTSAIARMQLTGKAEPPDDDAPTLTLAGGDVLVGTLQGTLKLDTAFDTLTLNAGEIKRVERAAQEEDASGAGGGGGGGLDVQVTLWDETKVSGQFQDSELNCTLLCGLAMKVPVALLEQYVQPVPQPSAAMVQKIKAIVAELDSDDWKQRDRAEAQLVSIGQSVVGVLKEMRGTQSPEAQQRIDAVLKRLAKSATDTSRRPRAGTPAGVPVQVMPVEE